MKRVVPSKDHQLDDAAEFRKELRAEVKRLGETVEKQGREIDTWREKYWQMHQENQNLRMKCETMKSEIAELRKQIQRP